MSGEKVMLSASDRLSLHGVLDLGRVEEILRSFASTLDEQRRQIDVLQSSLQQRAEEVALDGVKSGVDRALEAIERRFASLESRVVRLDQCVPRLPAAERALDRLGTALSMKADASELEQSRVEAQHELLEFRQSMKQQTADAESVQRLDGGQRQLAKQLNALQELISCKVDRVEIPLLESAGERVRAADEFRVEAGPRLDALELDLEGIRFTLDSKEEKSAVVERMQTIFAELQQRVQMDWVQRTLELPLEELTKRFEVLQCDVSLLQPQNFAETLRELRDDLKRAQSEQEERDRKIESIEAMLKSRASVRLVEKKADRTYCEQLVHEVSLCGEQRYAAADTSIVALKQEILELKRVQNAVDKKLSVSMRFLDWFSSVQLEKRSDPLPYQ